MKISYIIPHKNRNGLLEQHLKAMERSVFSDYEVIVIDDGSAVVPEEAYDNELWPGAGGARSWGATIATGDILMFVGDDCLPAEDLLLRHWYAHETNPEADIIQGYTMFHPSALGTYFMDFLDRSGLQANWHTLKNEDGSWKQDAGGFFLTTNVSIKRKAWEEIGEFSSRFPNAAWEDVEYGVRAQRNHFKTLFDPTAVNFHLHQYTYWEFCERQKMEGRNRLHLCLEHPEMASGLISPQALRDITEINELEVLNNGADIVNLALPELRETQEKIWHEGLQIMSALGLRESVIERGGVFNALLHIHTPKEVSLVLNTARALENKDYGYAQHCKTWILQENPENWAVMMLAAEVDKECGDDELAGERIEKARKIAPNEQWVKDFLL